MTQLILASASPRRSELMQGLNIGGFSVLPADIDETPKSKENPRAYVKRMAREKAQTIAGKNEGACVLAADTSVIVGRQILGKPANKDEAFAMIQRVAGRNHKVMTAVCVISPNGEVFESIVTTKVTVAPLRKKDILSFVENFPESWQGAAGAYMIQSPACNAFIKEIQGSYSNVVGLPLMETKNLLKRCGYDL